MVFLHLLLFIYSADLTECIGKILPGKYVCKVKEEFKKLKKCQGSCV